MFEDKKKGQVGKEDQNVEDIGSKGGQTQSEDVDFETEDIDTSSEELTDEGLTEESKKGSM